MIEFASGAEVAESLYLRTLWTNNIIILDTANFIQAHSYRNHRIEFTSGAEVDVFQYGEDVMDKK